MAKIATFTVALSRPASGTVTVDYDTADDTAVAYTDYSPVTGTLTFTAGQQTKTVEVLILADTTTVALKEFQLLLSAASGVSLPSPAYGVCRISGPPSYAAVAFPGRRVALVGDSITYQNNLHVVPQDVAGAGRQYYEEYHAPDAGYFNWANALMDNRLEFEPALQPNLNTANLIIPDQNHGYNTGVGGSRAQTWGDETVTITFQGLTLTDAGPMYAALSVIDKIDVVSLMGGTNDISWTPEAVAEDVATYLKGHAYTFAAAGKWVFIHTITPRSRGQLDGFTLTQRQAVQTKIAEVNQLLRDWIADDDPPNIWLVDHHALLLGPNGVDPAGTVSAPSTATDPDTTGNYKVGLTGTVMMYDGLHPSAAGAYVIGKKLAEVMIAAGVPAREAGFLGPCTLGPNLLANPNFTVSTSLAAVGGVYNKLGRARGLGVPLGAAVPGAPTYTNTGAGYQYGQVPDDWYFYRASNADSESFSNFNYWSYLRFDTPAQAALESKTTPDWETGHAYSVGDYVKSGADGTWYYQCDTAHTSAGSIGVRGVSLIGENYSTDGVNAAWSLVGFDQCILYREEPLWTDGAVVTSVVTLGGGVRGFRIVATIPATGKKNESLVVRTYVPRGQHGAWDFWGGATPTYPTEPYDPAVPLAAEATLTFSGLSANVMTAEMVLEFRSRNNTERGTGDYTTEGSPITSRAMNVGSPAYALNYARQHPENKTVVLRTNAVYPPTPVAGEDHQLAMLEFRFGVDASSVGGTFTVTISAPIVQTVTEPVGGL